MHEYAIVQELLSQAEHEAITHKASAIHSLTVSVGELAGVETQLLRTAFETFRMHSMCSGATLEIHLVKRAWVCSGCAHRFSQGAVLRCERCGQPARLLQGGEIVLEKLEMEVPNV